MEVGGSEVFVDDDWDGDAGRDCAFTIEEKVTAAIAGIRSSVSVRMKLCRDKAVALIRV